MAYKLLTPKTNIDPIESLGQCWVGESIEDQIALCPFQTIEPFFRKYIPKDGRVLEAGCGLGRWVFYLKRLGYDISGIEYSQSALVTIKAFDLTAPIQFGDINNLDFPDNHFKCMISLGVVEHFLEGPQKVLREAIRTIENQGLLLISVPTLNFIRQAYLHPMLNLRRFIRKKMGKQYEFSEYRFGKKEFALHLRECGLTILETIADDFTPPKSIGLFTDFRSLQHQTNKWELNRTGKFIEKILSGILSEPYSAGTFYICRVNK